MFRSSTDHSFSIMMLYEDILNLAFPIVLIAAAAATFGVVIGATDTAYTTLNGQIVSLSNSMSAVLNATLPK